MDDVSERVIVLSITALSINILSDLFAIISQTKKGSHTVIPFRGPDRIRTGVEAFAELCLATRPQDRYQSIIRRAKVGIFFIRNCK